MIRMVEEQFHRDVEGRPLRESRTPAADLRPDDIEYKTCPYSGTRQGQPMNVSALRQVSAHWDDILDALAFVRAEYVRLRGAEALDVMDVWRVSQLGSALPWWYVLGKGEPSPAYAAALAKATQGSGLWAQRVIVDALATRTPPPPLTAQTIVELAEANGTLLAEAEVCSGSERMLARFFDAMLAGAPAMTSPALASLAAERDRMLAFGAFYLNFKLVLYVHYLARRFVYADLGLSELLDAPVEPGDFFPLGPEDPAVLAGMPPASRAAWLAAVAQLVVPVAPDRSDAVLRGIAEGIAAALLDPATVQVRLDALLTDLVRETELGFRRAAGHDLAIPSIDAPLRDLVLVTPPRQVHPTWGS